MKKVDKISEELKKIVGFIEKNDGNFFITGQAGTGKSTLVRHFRETTCKNVVIVAPTGVAAVNIQGQTIHSFFKFKPGITADQVKKNYKDKELYDNIDVLIIDEISMVRADLLDCVDRALRLNGPNSRKPFGGVQLVVVGDLYQLPPIVRKEEELYFKNIYAGPYFFDAQCFKEADFKMIELMDIYRQSDEEFIRLLNAVRNCNPTTNDLSKINQRIAEEDFEPDEDDLTIMLVSTNAMADKINSYRLKRIPSKETSFIGTTYGEFKESELPTKIELSLKEGSQVMLLNNDRNKRWVNGDIGRIVKVGDDYVTVSFDDGREEDVTEYAWEKIKFSYDYTKDQIKQDIVGSFKQLPLKLAWAVTIHKGQGKTYDKVIIDLGAGAFVSGQAYVALSRCRTLEGVTLKTSIKQRDIIVDKRVGEFMNKYPRTNCV